VSIGSASSRSSSKKNERIAMTRRETVAAQSDGLQDIRIEGPPTLSFQGDHPGAGSPLLKMRWFYNAMLASEKEGAIRVRLLAGCRTSSKS
jgi:hypothetical protein